MPQALLFDYGGTLDTAARHWAHVLREGYQSTGYKVSEEAFGEAYVYVERLLAREPHIRPSDDFRTLLYKKINIEVRQLVEADGLSFPTAAAQEDAVHAITDYCNAYAARHAALSARVLTTLRSRYKLILVSNFYGNLHAVLQAYGLENYFDEVIESAVVGVRKPDPAIWQMGVEAAGFPAACCVAVGDSFTKDILPARAAGCETVWFKGEEWEPTERDETIPTHVITQLEDLLKWY